MKNNKKGFTLVELLAVIVILAIIALIATPIILGVIEDARKGAAKSSALGYIDAVEKSIAMYEVNTAKGIVAPGDGSTFTNAGISVNGDQPQEVSLVYSNGRFASGYIVVNNYKVPFANGKVNDNGITKTTVTAGSGD